MRLDQSHCCVEKCFYEVNQQGHIASSELKWLEPMNETYPNVLVILIATHSLLPKPPNTPTTTYKMNINMSTA